MPDEPYVHETKSPHDRIDELEVKVERIEKAVGTMASWLVQAQTGFGARDAAGIEAILRGES